MRFAILMTDGGGAWDLLTPSERKDVMEEQRKFRSALEAEGKYIASYQLAPRTEARTLRRAPSGRTSIVDGPFVESKEVVGGLYVIEAASLEEAMEWAKRSRFITGSNEVRPLVD